MKRIAVFGVLFSAAALLCAHVFAQDAVTCATKPSAGSRPSTSGSSERCWVVVDVTGYDATCTVCTSQEAVKSRQEQVVADNVARVKANRETDAEIKKLNGEVATKTRELSKAADDDAKAEIQKAIDDLKAQVTEKKSELKTLAKLLDPVTFNKRAEADKYVEQVYKDGEQAKQKALAKEKEKEAKKT